MLCLLLCSVQRSLCIKFELASSYLVFVLAAFHPQYKLLIYVSLVAAPLLVIIINCLLTFQFEYDWLVYDGMNDWQIQGFNEENGIFSISNYISQLIICYVYLHGRRLLYVHPLDCLLGRCISAMKWKRPRVRWYWLLGPEAASCVLLMLSFVKLFKPFRWWCDEFVVKYRNILITFNCA